MIEKLVNAGRVGWIIAREVLHFESGGFLMKLSAPAVASYSTAVT
jgi:hypothetical protein